MSHFTQLNLQGNSTGKTPNPSKTAPAGKKHHGTAKVAAIVGSFMAATLIALFTLGTNGCSKSKSEIAAPSNPTPAFSQPAALPAPAAPAETPKPAKKKSSRQHKLATYKNTDYGVSFRYPKHYALKEGEATNPEQTNQGPALNFVQPGGTTLSMVELPDTLYPGTDFTAAFFSVSVNPRMTADECGHFAFPEKTGAESTTTEPAKVNVAGTEYFEMDDSVSDASAQADAKYFHLYQNNACYEFVLGLQTIADNGSENLKPVNRDKVFDKLQWMLATVKIKQVEIPAASVTPEVSASTPTAPAPDQTNQ